jgi:putative ABC transport system permease protein
MLGLALGMGLSRMIASATDAVFRGAFGGLTEQAYGFQMNAPSIALAIVLGIGISLLASWIPARQGAAASPVEALRPMHFQQGLKPWRPRALLLTAILGAGAMAGTLQQSSSVLFYASMVLLYLAAVMAIPSFVLVIVRPLRPLCARLFPIEGTLALDSLARTPRRTATAIAALTLVFAQTVVIAGVNLSSRRTVETWIQGTFHSDLLLNSSADLAYQSFRFPPGFDAVLRAVPGIAAVQPVRSVHVPFRSKPVLVLASDYAPSAAKKVTHVITGDWRDMCRRTAAGEAVFVSEALALHEDLRPGSTVELTAPGGTLRLPVAGIVNDHSDKRGVIFLSLALYQRYWNDPTCDKFRLDVAAGQSVDVVRERLRRTLGDRYPATILTREDIRNYIFHPRGRLLTAPDMQLLVSMAVGTLALMNLASISVAERSRELALLRAIGGFRRQVRRTLLIELLVTVAIALFLGLLLGSLLLADLLTAVQRYVARVRLEYFFPWDVSLWLVAVSLAAGAIALLAVLPALARLPLSVALDSE